MSDPFEPAGGPSPIPPPQQPPGASQRGMSNSFVGGLFLVVVASLCGIGWYCSRHVAPVPSAPTSAVQPEQAGSVPTDWVRIVNRKTGKVIRLNERPVRIEPAGEFYKLRSRDGRYVSIAGWAKNGDEATGSHGLFRYGPDSGSPAMLWKIEPCSDGCWTITNCQSKKCLVSQDPADVVRQSAFSDGALEQEWQFATAPPPSIPGDNRKSAKSGGETRPAAQTPVAPVDAAPPPPEETAATPAGNSTDRKLDCDRLAIGDTGTLACAYVKIVEIIGDRTCIVLPYEYVQWSDFNSYTGLPNHIWYDYRPKLPIVLEGWVTSGKVTGEEVDVSEKVFRVTGTKDVRKTDGGVVRVHVLELVK